MRLNRVKVIARMAQLDLRMQAIKKAPAKALQTPKTAPQLTQGTQPAAQISDSSKSA